MLGKIFPQETWRAGQWRRAELDRPGDLILGVFIGYLARLPHFRSKWIGNNTGNSKSPGNTWPSFVCSRKVFNWKHTQSLKLNIALQDYVWRNHFHHWMCHINHTLAIQKITQDGMGGPKTSVSSGSSGSSEPGVGMECWDFSRILRDFSGDLWYLWGFFLGFLWRILDGFFMAKDRGFLIINWGCLWGIIWKF